MKLLNKRPKFCALIKAHIYSEKMSWRINVPAPGISEYKGPMVAQ